MSTLPPVDRRVHVRLAPDEAFELFTRHMRTWWPFVGHSCFDEDAVDVRFEPRVGGAVVEHARDGRTWAWGRLTRWAPPQGFAMQWFPGLSEQEATTLEVSVQAIEGGSELRVLHSGWEARGAAAAEKRDQYDNGWPASLAAFARAADTRAAA
jgi:hypothetical protein